MLYTSLYKKTAKKEDAETICIFLCFMQYALPRGNKTRAYRQMISVGVKGVAAAGTAYISPSRGKLTSPRLSMIKSANCSAPSGV